MEVLTFTPPLYKQRYQIVLELVEKFKAKKVVDLGCAECTLLSRLKFCNCIEVLAGVDTDLDLLREKMYRLSPLPCEYLQPRGSPLTVRLYQGSVAVKDPYMLDFDFVSCIELIEHLDPPVLEKFPEVVFGYMNPAIVVVSTPNADFNPLLPGLMGFRHWDHRFEWSREEFQAWSLDAANKYGYTVEFTGVGRGPPGTERLGYCTQIATFLRNFPKSMLPAETKNAERSYKLVYEVVYPSLKDKKILHDILLNEIIFTAETLRKRLMDNCQDSQSKVENCKQKEHEYLQSEAGGEFSATNFRAKENVAMEVYRVGDSIHIPLTKLFSIPKVQQLIGSLQQLQEILKATDRIALNSSGSAVVYPIYYHESNTEVDCDED
ncbi:small RNA 2'-O-methyltransferase [Callorhinchus milii]|uniref:Small RNA 2'-O-methyltransferase n=1 Tax=Callorhinchus milii TaxID=7868 RepID=A0A4W3I3V4_CALMI|nr:small RNA 2'-O-methyltransferase [Callorhinchus milii]XP_042190918.1 small RNA 2'-O-methyltransferase [Callorhinchus milii]XP_042190919.1 small RNA 2'-O-methyltransferase [Callorhinchus milii]XP_042190920.1 small RNA 2'-O-methyltransferase [Callorhinchus milii]XP_042190921.1 small RNA 2'-O-methyltransferase [Callorhinchus milii]|eukprot:gi/632940761/ref/XP_007885490.1/ PREDICTED: small RNA 2'-O-methyltransferase [Callorhinchus milii]